MADPFERFEVVHWRAGSSSRDEAIDVVREVPCALYVNRFELVTWMCTPVGLDRLALGFLLNERIVRDRGEIASIEVHDGERFFVDVELAREDFPLPRRRVLTSGCAGGVTFDDVAAREERVESGLTVPAGRVTAAVAALIEAARLYRRTRGVHTSALVAADEPDGPRLLAVEEDVGRHNTLDKIRGACALAGLDPRDRMLVSTGRISSEMLAKAARMLCPIVASRTSPTALSVRLARAWGITAIGYVRRDALTVYSHPERVIA